MGHLVRAYLGMSCANCDWLSNVQLDATTASQRASLTNQSTIAYSVVQKLVTGGVKMLTTSALEKTRQQREPTTSLPIITTTHENFNHPFYVTGAGTTPADRGGCKIESSATSGDDTVPSKDHTQVTGRWRSPHTHPCADRPILSIDGRCFNIGYKPSAGRYWWPLLRDLIDSLNAGQDVILHCHAGVHRAALCACFVLMFGLQIRARQMIEEQRNTRLDEILHACQRGRFRIPSMCQLGNEPR